MIVAASAQTLNDIHATSFGREGSEQMPGGEIHANALATLREGLPLRSAPAILDILLVLAMAFVVPMGSIRLKSPVVALAFVPLGAAAIFLAAAQLAFGAGLIVTVLYPMLAWLLALIGTLGLYYMVTAIERQRTRGLFSRFVPETVVDQVLAEAGGDLRLGGTRKQCTLLFSDLRSFTTASELLEPEVVIEIVNRYLSIMTEAIMDHGGTLITYMGDGIMALFGAPIEQADHADRAVAAAREMVATRLDEFNAWMQERGYGEGFRMGVGMNSGPVMVGERRFRAADGLHGDRRHRQHRLANRGHDQGHPAHDLRLRLHPLDAPAPPGGPLLRRRDAGPRPQAPGSALVGARGLK